METYVKQFLNQARRFPKHPAALDIQGAMTYDRLNRLSACLAERILKELGGEDRRGNDLEGSAGVRARLQSGAMLCCSSTGAST